MPHLIEHASSGRAKCRACGGKIAAAELRLGERLPNPFSDEGGEMTHWYHLVCAAYRRPEALIEAFEAADVPMASEIADRDRLLDAARLGVAHRRVPRVNAAERAPTGRATCRACKTPIEKGAWRISIVFYEEGRFAPGGFVHATCAAAYFETTDLMPRLKHFTPGLTDDDAEALDGLLRST